jgi:hypothetical protein
MALSHEASTVMNFLKKNYTAQGFPPIQEWWFQIPRKQADELTGVGYIEQAGDTSDNWVLTPAGHQWVMTVPR